MRIFRSLLPAVATAAFVLTAIRPAAAQNAAAPDYIRPVVRLAATAADPAPVRTVAVYRLTGARNLDIPTQVTVADSAGQLVATFRLSGDRAAGPMTVGARDTNLVLQGETRAGVFTLVLYHPSDPPAAGELVGSWSLGDRQGELRAGR
jgi:hypothetical protein